MHVERSFERIWMAFGQGVVFYLLPAYGIWDALSERLARFCFGGLVWFSGVFGMGIGVDR